MPYEIIQVGVVPNAFGPQPAVTSYNQTLWPAHCMQGSPGADFACPIDAGAIVVTKGTYVAVDSYSGFGDGVSSRASYPKAKETSILKVNNGGACGSASACAISASMCNRVSLMAEGSASSS